MVRERGHCRRGEAERQANGAPRPGLSDRRARLFELPRTDKPSEEPAYFYLLILVGVASVGVWVQHAAAATRP